MQLTETEAEEVLELLVGAPRLSVTLLALRDRLRGVYDQLGSPRSEDRPNEDNAASALAESVAHTATERQIVAAERQIVADVDVTEGEWPISIS